MLTLWGKIYFLLLILREFHFSHFTRPFSLSLEYEILYLDSGIHIDTEWFRPFCTIVALPSPTKCRNHFLFWRRFRVLHWFPRISSGFFGLWSWLLMIHSSNLVLSEYHVVWLLYLHTSDVHIHSKITCWLLFCLIVN